MRKTIRVSNFKILQNPSKKEPLMPKPQNAAKRRSLRALGITPCVLRLERALSERLSSVTIYLQGK
jgi:hypothetical protein